MPKTLGRIVAAAVAAGLWVSIAIVAAEVTHDFYRYVDRSVYVAVDDSEAGVAYSLATEGRYGFLASPTLLGMSRTHGQFNYGPWYFYLAAALIWLFGYSLTLVRSIHLWTMLGAVLVGGFWFRGRDRPVAAALFGFGILYCFDFGQWPMARPDSLVSVFALALVVCAGLATTRSRPRYWFGVGLAAACGALTHLIAVTLLPSGVLLFLVSSQYDVRSSANRRSAWRRVGGGAVALVAGLLLGLTMFYASFGFDFASQWRFLVGYREATATSTGFLPALMTHFSVAFGYLPHARQIVGATLVSGWIAVAWTSRLGAPARPAVQAYLLPPLLVWSAYLLSNGVYTNYHAGYGILHQVLFTWTGTTMVWLGLRRLRERSAAVGATVSAILAALLLVQGARQIQWQFAGVPERARRTESWVAFTDYSNHVLNPIPARSTAWGSLIFGIEVPDRIQLIQLADALMMLPRVPRADQAALWPDFLVWGYPEVRDNVRSALRGDDTLLARLEERAPEARFRVVSMVAAAPYGVTRTYARRVGATDAGRTAPHVSVYDPARHQWLTRLGKPVAIDFVSVAPATLRIGYEAEPAASVATRTVAAVDLPADHYFLRVTLKPGSGDTKRRLLAVTSSNMLRQTMGELGPEGDFAAYLAADTELFMLITHPGGTLYVSQMDDGVNPEISSVTAYPITDPLDPSESPSRIHRLPDLASWEPTKGLTARPDGDTLRVFGDATALGYQIASPLMRAHARDKITLRVRIIVESGKVCPGILNGTGQAWLVAPDAPRDELRFVADATPGFHVVVANCNAEPGQERSQFVIGAGTYLNEPIELYVDRFVAAALQPRVLERDEPPTGTAPLPFPDPSIRTFPPGLRVTRSSVLGPLEPIPSTDIVFKADIVQRHADTWTIKGEAAGKYSYLWRVKDRHLATNARLVVTGHLERGGISIGLLQKDKWVAQVSITEPGDFTVVIAPPSSGFYSVLFANDLQDGLETSIVLTRVGVLP